MFGLNVVHIDQDGSPSGPKHLLLCDPQSADSCISQMIEIVLVLLSKEIRTIVFAKSRKCCELAFSQLSKRVQSEQGQHSRKIMSYRAGYSIPERRQIENDLFNGDLLVVISTNALELGLDIGNLQAVVHLGFPHSMASYHQQLGRCGRRDAVSYSIMIPDPSCPIDQKILTNPQILFQSDSFSVTVDYSDPLVVQEQLACAAGDLPLTRNDQKFFEPYYDRIDEYLVHDTVLQAHIPPARFLNQPSQLVNIRTKKTNNIRVIDMAQYREIGYVEFDRVAYTLYPGAVYQFQGTSFLVNTVQLDHLVAFVYPSNVEYLTYARCETSYHPRTIISNSVHFGQVECIKSIYGYTKYHPSSKKIIEVVEIPAMQISETQYGAWKPYNTNIQGLHALAHTVSKIMGAIIPQKIKVPCPTDSLPILLLLHDEQAVAKTMYEKLVSVLEMAYDRLSVCPCVDDGCTECIIVYKCQAKLSKQLAINQMNNVLNCSR
jgi:DEAD/DEAH box helicase domain-containing protein